MSLYLDGNRILGNGYDYGSEMPMSPNNNNKVADEIDGKVDTSNFYGKLLPMSTTDPDKVADRIEALENKDIIDDFSTITENQTGVTLANSTFVTVASKSLTKGYYVIAGTVQFSSDENGMRILILDNSETDTNTEINSIVVKGRGTLQKVRCMKIMSSTTIYLRGYQSSGSSMSGVRGYLEIMKVV